MIPHGICPIMKPAEIRGENRDFCCSHHCCGSVGTIKRDTIRHTLASRKGVKVFNDRSPEQCVGTFRSQDMKAVKRSLKLV